METKQELEEEVKTLKGLRRTYCKDFISGMAIAYFCGVSTIEYIRDQQIEIAIIGGIAGLASMLFSCKNMPAYDDIDRSIQNANKKLIGLENSLY